MRINFKGRLEDQRELRVGVIGCGSHSFRNIFPVFQFVRANLAATCDYQIEKAKAFCEEFGGEGYYSDYMEMLKNARLDAVLMIVGNDGRGRPMYPKVAADCLRAGAHTWVEKPPAATTAEIEDMMKASVESGRLLMVGYKKQFVQAYVKAKELALSGDFGGISMAAFQNPEVIPPAGAIHSFLEDEKPDERVMMFMEHLCHPVSQMLSLLGMPESMSYERTNMGSGIAVFHFPGDAMATVHFLCGMAMNGGVERTMIVSRRGADSNGRIGGRHIIIDNNLTLTYHRNANFGYGDETNFYKGSPDENTAVWQPEFSRGQMFNKGLFLLGYYDEIREFTDSILESRPPRDGTLEQAWMATHIFEKFAEGPGKTIKLGRPAECYTP